MIIRGMNKSDLEYDFKNAKCKNTMGDTFRKNKTFLLITFLKDNFVVEYKTRFLPWSCQDIRIITQL